MSRRSRNSVYTFSKKFVTIVFFTIVTIVLEFIAEKAGVASRLGSYSAMHSVLLDFAALVVLLEYIYGIKILICISRKL